MLSGINSLASILYLEGHLSVLKWWHRAGNLFWRKKEEDGSACLFFFTFEGLMSSEGKESVAKEKELQQCTCSGQDSEGREYVTCSQLN